MQGDGDGWTRCAQGHDHWGRFGAAGLLLRAPDSLGVPHVLLQHRAPWSHDGDTWGIPGGARDSTETPVEAALREAWEEASVPLGAVRVGETLLDDHGEWSYTTVVADAGALLATTAQRESVELRWVPEPDVAGMPLHRGFAATWPRLRATPVRLLVDTANAVGARPDGWWRDRAGATGRLLARLVGMRGRTVRLPDERFVVVTEVTAVVEGRAAGVPDVAGMRVVRAPGSGDDALAAAAAGRPDGAAVTVVVTADRGLRRRLPPATVAVGPGWLLRLLDDLVGPPREADAPGDRRA